MLDKIINSINPDNKDFDDLTSTELMELLTKLNRLLRCLDDDEEVVEEDMIVGDLVSPTREVQLDTLDYLTQNIGKVQDKKAKAAVVYYTLLNLHMFSDGNGRTSRFMYDLISGDLSDENIAYYFHEDSIDLEEQKNDLEKSKGIADVSFVNKIPDEFLAQRLGYIPQEILDNYYWITVGHTRFSAPTSSIIPSDALEQLSENELKDLDKILRDGYGMKLCPSGLAMLCVSLEKGELGKWISKNEEDIVNGRGLTGRLNFSVYRNPDMIADWSVQDIRKIISVGNAAKFERLKCMIDVFTEPSKYVNDDSGYTYADEILNPSGTEDSIGRMSK